MPWSQLTKVKNFTVILLYINLRVNIEKDDNIFKIIQVKRYIHIGNKVRMWKFNSKFLMFMKVSNSPTFLRLFLLKILAWGWGCSSAGQWSWALGSPLGPQNNRKRGSVNNGHQTLHFFPLSMRKRPKSQPDDAEGQISDKIQYYIQLHLNIPGNQFQFVPSTQNL